MYAYIIIVHAVSSVLVPVWALTKTKITRLNLYRYKKIDFPSLSLAYFIVSFWCAILLTFKDQNSNIMKNTWNNKHVGGNTYHL